MLRAGLATSSWVSVDDTGARHKAKNGFCTQIDRIFRRRTGFVTLDRLLARLHANKAELLMVLERPEIPLHTNGSENDIRCQVTRRKVSAGTRSDAGRDCRDAFLGLAKTCAKHGVAFWNYLGSRLETAVLSSREACQPFLGREREIRRARFSRGGRHKTQMPCDMGGARPETTPPARASTRPDRRRV